MQFLTRLSVSSVHPKSKEPFEGNPLVGDLPTVQWNRYALFFALATLGCALDLVTKHYIFQWRGDPRDLPPQHGIWWLWEGYIGIETSVNTGALFGFGRGMVGPLAVVSLAAIVGVLLWLFVYGAARDLHLTVALGCVFGGILGNLYDRLGLSGRVGVRDWILFRYGDFTWPNFNIADSLLVCGAALMVWHGFRGPAATPDASGPSPETKT